MRSLLQTARIVNKHCRIFLLYYRNNVYVRVYSFLWIFINTKEKILINHLVPIETNQFDLKI